MPISRPIRTIAAIAVGATFMGFVLAVVGFPGSVPWSSSGGPAVADVTLARYEGGCFLMFEEGRFEFGGPTGSQLFVPGNGRSVGAVTPGVEHAIALLWPDGVAVRQSWLGIVVVDSRGTVLARHGQRAHVGGGYGAGGFWACGQDATFPLP